MAKNILKTELYSAEGHLLWCSENGTPAPDLDLVASTARGRSLLKRQLKLSPDPSWPVKRSKVLAEAERLEFVSRQGNAKGFLTILPRGMAFEACIDAFNSRSESLRDAVRIDFPLVFDHTPNDIQELTISYERQSRMFRLGGEDSRQRLSYAADPNLFSWLRGRTLVLDSLPYAIYSPSECFRRVKKGEIAGIDITRQYRIPDLHVLCAADNAMNAYQHHIQASSDDVRFFFGEDFVQYHEICIDLADTHGEFAAATARAANCPTVVHWLATRPRYYGIKTGLMIDGGFGDVRLITLQWDDTNGERFNIRTPDGKHAIIVHATLIGGWPKLLPLLIGRGLADYSARVIPAELSAHQVVCLPVRAEHAVSTQQCAMSLSQSGIRAYALNETRQPLNSRIGRCTNSWHQFVAVIGDRELDGGNVVITEVKSGKRFSVEEHRAQFGARFARCNPSYRYLNARLPFVATQSAIGA